MRRISANLYVFSELMRPERITEALGLVPDGVTLKGSERTPPRSYPKRHSWSVSVVDCASGDPAEVVRQLLLRIAAVPGHLPVLRAADPAVILRLGIWIDPGPRPPLFFDADIMRALARLQCELDIEVCFPDVRSASDVLDVW